VSLGALRATIWVDGGTTARPDARDALDGKSEGVLVAAFQSEREEETRD
jgi:hypothetical protein